MLNRYVRAQCVFMRTAKTLIRLGRCPGLSESMLGAQSFCWFCHEATLNFFSGTTEAKTIWVKILAASQNSLNMAERLGKG